MKEGFAVRCEQLHFTYESASNASLQGVDVEIERGTFTVIAGPSGAGKSTFCRTLNNIIPVFFRGTLSGMRRVDDVVLEKQPIASLSSRIGMVFQEFEQQLFSTSSTLELSFVLENFGFPAAEMQDRIRSIAERL